ncbi:MAG: hypothetical protein K2K80_06400, partial [Clostridia bacterium]|nr:hypothetical protein [Clostridia bacterium]
NKRVWYNSIVKKKITLLTSLCALAIGAASFTGTAALAAENDAGLDYYPVSFTKQVAFERLEDYAICGEKFAFLQDNVIYEYSDEKLTSYSEDQRTATAVYYDNNGALCYGNANGIYIFANDEKVEIETKSYFDIGSYHYYTNGTTGTVNVLNTSSADGENPVTTLEGFSLLKEFSGKAYAVKESEIYEIKGATPEKLPALTYLDYSDTKRILAGDINSVLKTFSLEKPCFVTLTPGAFMTEVDIDTTNGEYFSTGKTLKAGVEVPALSALLLAKTGANDSISLVMVCGENDGDSQCYLINSINTRPVTRETVNILPTGTTATVTVAKGYIYSAPYVCAGTHVADEEIEIEIESGLKLEVLGEVTKSDNPELVLSFYKIRFTEDGKVRVGYVPTGYVSHFTFVENKPIETPDPDYSEENLIRIVVLVLLVVALVLGAGGYMVYQITTGKRKNGKKEKRHDNDD